MQYTERKYADFSCVILCDPLRIMDSWRFNKKMKIVKQFTYFLIVQGKIYTYMLISFLFQLRMLASSDRKMSLPLNYSGGNVNLTWEAIQQLFNASQNNDAAGDATWILTSAFIIFTMQSGFGLLEAGN